MPDLVCGTAGPSGRIRFLAAEDAVQVEPVVESDGALEIKLRPREWDVTDDAARERAGRQLLGGAYERHCEARTAQWFIRPEINAACLLVYG